MKQKKMIKKVKIFPTGGIYLELTKEIETNEEWVRLNDELDKAREKLKPAA